MLACSSCGRENPDDARFCAGCGAKLEVEDRPVEVRKIVTVVFCDVTGSTELGEQLDPESLRHVMARYFGAMRDVLERHGGSIEKFIGDAVVAVFGIPLMHEDDAIRAVRAAAEIRGVLEGLNDDLEGTWGVRIAVRTGVNTGEVVVGREDTGESLVLGDAVNVAARLEQAAEPGEILIGAETLELVRDAVTVEPVELQLKGKGDVVHALRLVDVEEGAPGRARRLDSPIVGREYEQRLLNEAFARTSRESACHLFTILGAAGVGKSRLVHEFVSRAGARVATGRCLPYGEGITYWPLVEALRQALGVHGDEPDETRRRLRDVVGDHEGSDDVAVVVEELLGVGEHTSSPTEMVWAVRRFLEGLAQDAPLVLVFDDIHWAEPALLDLIEHLADMARGAPLLLVCVARPELLDARPMWGGGKLNATSVLLEPLDADESGRLLDNLLGSADVSPDVRKRIAAAAEGNPLFVEEMVAMLVDEGLLVRRNGGWVARDGLAAVDVPPTIQVLLAARLDRLLAEERTVLERASIEGKTFHRSAVEALVAESEQLSCGQSLQALMRKDLIRPDEPNFSAEDAFKFRHILLRDAAYRGIPKELRSTLHELLARWLEQKADRAKVESDAILGYHLEQAFRYRHELGLLDERTHDLARRAAERLLAAGRRSLRRGDVSAGASLLARAVDLLRFEGDPPGGIALELAEALRATGELGRAATLLAETTAAAAARGDVRLEEHARLESLILRSLSDPGFRTSELLSAAESAIGVLERAGDNLGLAKAWRGVAEVHLTSCQWQLSAVALDRALEHARRAQDDREVTLALPLLANAIYWGPMPVPTGIARCEELLAEAGSHRSVEASVVSFLAGLHAMQGDFDEARSQLARSRGLFEELGHTYGLATLALVAGPVELLAAAPAAAQAELERSCRLLEEMGETGTLASAAAFLAEALEAGGRAEEAQRWAGVSEETAAEDDVAAHVVWRTVRAALAARAGNAEAAEALAREALALVEQTDFLNMQADVSLTLAEVLRSTGRDSEAEAYVIAAARLYELKGNTVSADRAHALLIA